LHLLPLQDPQRIIITKSDETEPDMQRPLWHYKGTNFTSV